MKCPKCKAAVGVEIMPSIYKPSNTEAHCCTCGWLFEFPTAMLERKKDIGEQITEMYKKSLL